MCKKQLSVAFFQQDIAWENPAANFALVEQMLAQHIAQGHAPDMLVLPETFNVGFGNNMAALAEPPDGDSYRFARSVAQRHRLLFVATWPVREGEKVYNRLHWVFPDGSHGHYDKAHTFRMSSEATQLARGTCRATFEWRGWRIRPAVCYDLRFPLWLRNRNLGATTQELAPKAEMLQPQLDYDLLLVSANWPASRHEAWCTLLRARAIENQSYLVGVNRVGVDGTGISYRGDSAVIDFKGQPVVEAAPGEQQLLAATLDKDALHRFRSHWPFWLDADEA